MIKTLSILLLLHISTYAEVSNIVAHRGSCKEAPENTIPAFKLAWKQGADAIEGDFLLTKDDYIVCIHDRNTKRLARKNLIVRESTLAELRTLDVGMKHGKQYKGAQIPLISEVFATVPRERQIYIEIKCGIEIIPPLLKEIDKSGLKNEQIVIISFNHEVIKKMKRQAPQYKAFWLSGMKKKKSGEITPSLKTVLSTLKALNADGFSSHHNHIDGHFIKEIHKNGYEYHVWTIDDAKIAMLFSKWGAKSITTNVPAFLKKSLSSTPKSPSK